MATFSGWTSTRYAGAASSRNHILGATPASGDVVFVFTYRGNGNQTAPFNHASASGSTEIAHVDPTNVFRLIGTAFHIVATGGETSVNVDWGANDGEADQVIESVIVSGADVGSIVGSLGEVEAATWAFPADSLDHSIHTGATQQNNDISTDLYPSGDTNITHSTIDWRNGGLSLSGGNTATADFGENLRGALGTISFDDAQPGPNTNVTSIAQNDSLAPNTNLFADTVAVTITGTGPITQVDHQLIRDSDGFYWWGSDWQAGSHFYSDTAPNDPTPYNHIIDVFLPTSLDAGESYTLQVRATDVDGTGSWSTRNFDAGTWVHATPHTITANDGGPGPVTITADTPADGATNVNRAAVTFSGDVDDSATNLKLRILNTDDSTVRTAAGTYVADNGTNHKLDVTHDTANDRWTFGPIELPAGSSMRYVIESD